MNDDILLRSFVEQRDEQAFRAIVDRYIGVVYSSARRQVIRFDLAEDVTQAVFILLAQKAPCIRPNALAGWLIETARYTAMTANRRENNLRRREEKVAMMNRTRQELARPSSSSSQWDDVSPLVDDALARLTQRDRLAVTLRYLQGESIATVAASMGVSEATATKRIHRALDRLRDYFSRRGVSISAAAADSCLLQHARLSPPPHLAQVASASATGANGAAGREGILELAKEAAASSPSLLTRGVLAAMMYKAASVSLATAALIALVTVAVIYQVTHAQASRPSASTTPTSQPAKIRAGVIVSHFTATGPSWRGVPYGYAPVIRIVQELRDPSIEVIPIIEAGSESDESLAGVLKKEFAGKQPVIAVDAAHLADLDVIVAAGIANASDEVLNSVEARVKAGAGLLIRQSFGVVTPEYTPQVTALNGLAEGQYALTSGGSGKVIAEHPLLGKLKIGQTVRMVPNGAYGKLAPDGVGLIEMATGNLQPLGKNIQQREDFVFYPLYISQLGKGKIVGCSFSHSQPVPPALNAATGGKFTVRCVKWLAGKPLD